MSRVGERSKQKVYCSRGLVCGCTYTRTGSFHDNQLYKTKFEGVNRIAQISPLRFATNNSIKDKQRKKTLNNSYTLNAGNGGTNYKTPFQKLDHTHLQRR